MGKISRETKQKAILKDEIEKQPSYFTCQELFNRIKSKHPEIGIATIYRFLKELRREGKVHSYSCNRNILYSLSNSDHCHFTCENCGKTEHISLEDISPIKNKVKGEICHIQIDIHGLCEKCKKK